MKAYLIDPLARTVSEVDYDGTLQRMYDVIGCKLIEAVYIEKDAMRGDTCFVDEEGLLHDDEHLKQRGFFILATARGDYTLAGRGLVLGVDEHGESVSPRLSLNLIGRLVTWPAPSVIETAKEMRDTPPTIVMWPNDKEEP